MHRPPSTRKSDFILLTVCAAALVLPLSFAGAIIALPSMRNEFNAPPGAFNWVVNAFMLSFGSCLLTAGSLADRWGRKRIFSYGMGLFSLSSLLIGFSPDLSTINVFRGVQGIAAAAALSGGSAALAQEFEGQRRTQAFSMLGTTFGIGLAFGPLVSGLMLQFFGWRSIFLSGTVIGILVLVLGIPHLNESRDPEARNFDWPGSFSFTIMLALLTYAILAIPDNNWPIPLGLAGVALIAFIFIETKSPQAMLDLSLFRYPLFVGVQLLPLATSFSYVVLLVVLPVRLIAIEHYSDAMAGMILFALSSPMLVVPYLTARLAVRVKKHLLCCSGLLLAAAGLGELALLKPGAALLPMPWGLMDGLSVSVVPKNQAGMATGIFSTMRIAGEGVSIALISALMSALVQRHLIALSVENSLPSQNLARAAQHLAGGDLAALSGVLPMVSTSTFLTIYSTVFQTLALILSAMTLLLLVTIYVLFRRTHRSSLHGENP
jgi:MFS family permease